MIPVGAHVLELTSQPQLMLGLIEQVLQDCYLIKIIDPQLTISVIVELPIQYEQDLLFLFPTKY